MVVGEEIQSETPEEILSHYSLENWHELQPRLSEASQLAITAYFRENNMTVLAGYLSMSSEVYRDEDQANIKFSTREDMLGVVVLDSPVDPETKRIYAQNPGSVVGPYFIEGEYQPNGIAIWANRTKTE